MPELQQIIDKKTPVAPALKKPTKPIEATPAVAATVKTDTPTVKVKPIEATVINEEKKVVKPKPAVKKPETKVESKEIDEVKESYIRPPIEQIVRDFDAYIETLNLAGYKIVKLGYKCGKIIFGLPANVDGTDKDFRIIAYKARKKTKSVSGKSRVIFYFGIHKETKKYIKEILGAASSKFGKCSVQVSEPAEPIEFKIDKVIFSDTFNKNVTKVMDSLKKLCDITITQKTSVFDELKEKKEKKEKKSTTE
jgi:hypothetical protein